MQLEQKVIGLESAKKLKKVCEDKGVVLPESEYFWIKIQQSMGNSTVGDTWYS